MIKHFLLIYKKYSLMKILLKSFAIYLLFWVNIAYAQSDQRAQELKRKLAEQSAPDTSRFLALDDLIWHYRNKDFIQAKHYAQEALQLAQKIGYQKGLAVAYVRLGLIYHNQAKYDSALYYCQKSLKIEEKINHVYGMARAKNEIGIVYMLDKKYKKAIAYFNESIAHHESINQRSKTATKKTNLGTCYKDLGDYQKAIQYHLEAIDLYKNKTTGQIGVSYLGLGTLYQKTNHFNTAYEYLMKALEVFQKENNQLFLAKTYHELGLILYNLGDDAKAVEYYQQSLNYKKKLKTDQNIQITYNNLAQVYIEQAKFAKARKWLDQSLELAAQKKDTLALVLAYNNLGMLHCGLGQYQEAIAPLTKALLFSEKLSEKYIQKKAFRNISLAYSRLGNYRKAFEYYQQFNGAKDSLEASFRQAMDLKDAYQKQKQKSEILKKNQTIQQKELARVQEVSRRRQLFNYFLGASLFLLFIAVIAIVRNYQARQNVRKRQDKIDELLDEQEFIALSKMLEGQEQERDRIAQDLHDRLGSMLSMVQLHFGALKETPETAQVQEAPQYQKATQLLDNACEEVRKVAHDISSSLLRKFGLLSALSDLKDNLEQTNSLQIDLIDNGFDNQRLPANYETQIYRIVQEMVSNVLKHAQARRLEIQLLWTEENLHISAYDDGRGFNIQKLEEEKSGMGLRGIESRVKGLYGECKIDSTEGKGTTIMIDLPI